MSTSERPTKAQRREEAKVAVARMREEQERKAKTRRTLGIAGAVVAVAVLAVTIILIVRQGDRARLEDIALRPQGSTLSGAIPVGADGVAGSTAGSADDAVVVSIYTDYMCPICGEFEKAEGADLDKMREAGDIVVEYHPVSILDRASKGTSYSTRAATAAALVADKAPDVYLAFNEALFTEQPAEDTEGLTGAQIAKIARDSGVPEEIAATIESGEYLGEFLGSDAVDGARPLNETYVPWVTAVTAQASEDLGNLATPTILINGVPLDTEKYSWQQPGSLAQAVADARG